MTFLIVAAIFLGFVLWLLFAPITISINTYEDNYQLSLMGVLRIRYIPDETGVLKGRSFFIPFRIRPDSVKTERKKKDEDKEAIPEKNTDIWRGLSQVKFYSHLSRKILFSFRIQRLYAQVDTGDVVINAYLYPLALLYKTKRFDVNINFDDELGLILIVKNRLWNFARIGAGFALRKLFRK